MKNKELLKLAKNEANRLENMGTVSKRIARGIRDIVEYSENMGAPIYGVKYSKFAFNSGPDKLSIFEHFLTLVSGACFLYIDDDIKDAYLWHDKQKHDNDPSFYLRIEASYLARAFERIKKLENNIK